MEGPLSVPMSSDSSSVHVSLGGRLQYFLSFWKTITNDVFILDMIKGVHIPFDTEISFYY